LVLLLAHASVASAVVPPREAAPHPQQEPGVAPVLTNREVVLLLNTDISPQVVVAKIRASRTNFDTSAEALRELKKEGVPDDVLVAMINASASPSVGPSPAAESLKSREIKLADGTPLELQLASSISSETTKADDLITFTIIEPLIIDGVRVIEQGTTATGRIVVVKKAGRWGRAGKLGWVMQHVVAADGTRVPLRMSNKLVGDSKGGTVATGAIVTGLIFWPAAPLWGIKRGKNAVYPVGTRFKAFVHGDTKVGVKDASATPAQQ
jgi:hypothetical protein